MEWLLTVLGPVIKWTKFGAAPSRLQLSREMNEMPQGLKDQSNFLFLGKRQEENTVMPISSIFSIHVHALFLEQHRKYFNNCIM